MPFQRQRYPKDWPQVRERILRRAGNRCEGCRLHPECRAANHEPHPETGSQVVLTIAHIHDPDPANCDPANLKALCQRCHLAIDRPRHLAKQKAGREKRAEQRQPPLPGIEP